MTEATIPEVTPETLAAAPLLRGITPLGAPLPEWTLIRASVQGIVYLIHSQTGQVYTYNVDSPTYIGQLERIPEEEKHLMSKQNGCLHYARVKYIDNIKEVMVELRESSKK